MKLVKKFTDFVNNMITENTEPIELPDSFESEEGEEATERVENIDQSNLIDDPELNGYEEEESGEYEGTIRMKQLSEMLGSEIVNNQINFEGHKIVFASETNTFLIDNRKPRSFGCKNENDPAEIKECLTRSNTPIVESRKNRLRRK